MKVWCLIGHLQSINLSHHILSNCFCCSVTKLCLTVCDPMDYSMPSFPVLHYVSEFAQIHVLWVSGAIQPFHPPLPSSLFAFNLSQHQGLFWLFISVGQSIGASASASDLLMNIQNWFPLELTGLISFLSKGLWRVFSSTTIRKHHFFSTQPSLWSNSHICTWLLEKP